ncbi:MAG: glycosyltransferase family 4 protein [Calditrichaeota bacterium]|nr:glycosyltransferase family 4 protein [Calditrichota bacterium]
MKGYAGKVLIIVQNLPVPFDRRVWLEAQTLRDHGYKVSVISPKSKEFTESYERIDDIAVYRYKMPVNAQGALSYFFEFAYAWLATASLSLKVLFREGFDIIQACNPPDTYFLLARFYKLFGKKFVFDHHDLSPEMFEAKYDKKGGLLHKMLLLLEKWTLKTADIIISTNESYKNVAMSRGGRSEEDIFVVRTGPDLQRLRIMPPENALKRGRKYMVAYLGEMCPQDGVDYLLRSIDHFINKIGRKDVQFTLIGGGPAMEDLEKMSDEMGMSDHVAFTGRIPDEELCRYLSTADVCVDPDPFSEWADHSTMNKILEYMTFAKPIVSFDLTEAKHSAQQAAVYVPPDNTEQFAAEIDKLLDDPLKREEMGRFGRRRVVDHLAWRHTHKALLRAYDKVSEFIVPAEEMPVFTTNELADFSFANIGDKVKMEQYDAENIFDDNSFAETPSFKTNDKSKSGIRFMDFSKKSETIEKVYYVTPSGTFEEIQN